MRTDIYGARWLLCSGPVACEVVQYLNWLIHDAVCIVTLIQRFGLWMFSVDLLEDSNRVLKDIWSSFSDRVAVFGGEGNGQVTMLGQVNERLLVYFEVHA